MMIEPTGDASAEPVIDIYTRRMAAAWRDSIPSEYAFRGVHFCKCGVPSDNYDHFVCGLTTKTNSLCVHYLAFHRDEVPFEQLEHVLSLTDEEVEPTHHELKDPKAFAWDSSSNDI